MALILIGVFFSGLIASKLLLEVGVRSMLTRYSIVVVFSYIMSLHLSDSGYYIYNRPHKRNRLPRGCMIFRILLTLVRGPLATSPVLPVLMVANSQEEGQAETLKIHLVEQAKFQQQLHINLQGLPLHQL